MLKIIALFLPFAGAELFKKKMKIENRHSFMLNKK
jgi:hypothetical protein